MLRLRATIERARRRRWLGLLIIVLLALLVVFVLIHDSDHALEGAAAACISLVAIFTTLIVCFRRRFVSKKLLASPSRAPPARNPRLQQPVSTRRLALVPLRL